MNEDAFLKLFFYRKCHLVIFIKYIKFWKSKIRTIYNFQWEYRIISNNFQYFFWNCLPILKQWMCVLGQGVFSITNRKVVYITRKGLFLPNFHITFCGLLLEIWKKLLYISRLKTQLSEWSNYYVTSFAYFVSLPSLDGMLTTEYRIYLSLQFEGTIRLIVNICFRTFSNYHFLEDNIEVLWFTIFKKVQIGSIPVAIMACTTGGPEGAWLGYLKKLFCFTFGLFSSSGKEFICYTSEKNTVSKR